MFIPPPGEEYIEPNILVNCTRLDVVHVFFYLGSVLSKDCSLDAEVYARIQKASVAFGRLERRVCNDRGLTINTKLDVYMVCVVIVLLYTAKTWTTHQRHFRVLEHFHLKCLRKILNIKWQMHTPDTEVLEKALCPSLESMITTAPKRLFCRELASGKRPQHKHRKRYKDGLKSNLKDADIDADTREATVVDRGAWRELVKNGCGSLHVKRLERARLKRALRKGNRENLPGDHTNWICEMCRRVLLSKAGYVNHMKSYTDRPSSSSVPQQPDGTVCDIFGKVCKSVSGLKRQMVVHKVFLMRIQSILLRL